MQTLSEASVDQTFIRLAEVWRRDGQRLRLVSENYGPNAEFACVSRKTSFGRGEGLPGRAWMDARPIVLNSLDDEAFVRREAASAIGLTSAVAVPVFAAGELKAVLVLLCSADKEHAGAIEIWEHHADNLKLADGYYGHADAFAAASRVMSFAHGQGLPGGVWASNTPILMQDLGRPGAFLRSAEAEEAGLKTGLGVPIPCPGGRYVLTLLSSAHTPIARRFELWDARPQRVGPSQNAVLIDGICEIEGPLWPQQNPPVDVRSVGIWEGPLGRVLGSGLPYVQSGNAGLPANYAEMIALPIYQGSELAYIVAWYL